MKIEGEHHELVFRGNRIGFGKPPAEKQSAIQAGNGAKKLTMADNEFVNVDPQ